MEKTEAPLDVSKDVLHIPAQTKLSPEEIAKAVAHHNRHHPDHGDGRSQQSNARKATQGKKQK